MIVKKTKIIDIHHQTIDDDQDMDVLWMDEYHQIPDYLMKTNTCFLQWIDCIQKESMTTITMDEIQELALFIHRTAHIHFDRELMKHCLDYVCSTIGESYYVHLVNVIPLHYYPVQVQSLMMNYQKRMTSIIDTCINEQAIYKQLIQQRLKAMCNQIEQYQKELIDKKMSLLDRWTPLLERTLSNYVYKYGIQSMEKKQKLDITLMKYDYELEIIHRQYLHEQPNEYQVSQYVF